MKNLKLKKDSVIHLIGIGGVSMSGIAEILINLGYKVTGSDTTKSYFTEKLKKKNIKITYQHLKENINQADLICYSAAIKNDNPEIIESKKLGKPIIERCDLLGKITKMYNKAIAIAGSHGKTTVTSMITNILIKADKEPNALIGAYYPKIDGNVLINQNQNYFVYEACEYVESFLKFYSFASVITNIEADHLDYYADLKHLISSFEKFSENSSNFLVLNADDENSKDIIKNSKKEIITFGINNKSNIMASNIENKNGVTKFKIIDGKYFQEVFIKIPGKHNVYNSIAAYTLTKKMGIDPNYIIKALEEFEGVERRFQIIGEIDGITVIDDYAHHPTEILETLTTIRNMNFEKIWCVFQSHTYTRTSALLNEFAESLKIADNVIVTDIYAAREKNKVGIHPNDLCKKIDNSIYISGFDKIAKYLKENVKQKEVIVTMGAGNINEVGELFIKMI